MTARADRAQPVPSNSSRGTTFFLALMSALALALRLCVSRLYPIDYNDAWHLFIARNFTREYASLAHPPLFIALLKGCDAVSHTLLAFRLFSILGGVGSVFLVGRILEKLGALPAITVLAALSLALSRSAVVISLKMESYSLCIFFVLASFYYYLDIASAESAPARRSRVAFSALACLAVLSHYFAGLFLTACVLAPLAVAAIWPRYHRALRGALPRRWRADLLTFLPPLLVGAASYLFLTQPWMRKLSYYSQFYYRPGEETIVNFWVRNMRETFNLFAPFALPRARYALPPLLAFLGIVIWAPATEKRDHGTSPSRLLPAALLTALLALGMVLGLVGRYPFGGQMRHQLLLFVFALLAGFVAVDRLLRRLASPGQVVFTVLCLGAIAANFAASLHGITVPPPEALVGKKGIFQGSLSQARTVHVDQFNLIGMVMDYYGWDWRFAGQVSANPVIERYELTRARQGLSVLAHRGRWIMDFGDPTLYSELRAAFGTGGTDCETVFCVYRNFYAPPSTKLPERHRAALETRIPSLAAAAGLQTRRLVLSDDAVYAEFCGAPDWRISAR